MRDPEIPHRYICECGDPSCVRDVLLTSSEWLPLSERGRVVHFGCLDRIRAKHLEGFRVVQANAVVGYAVVALPVNA